MDGETLTTSLVRAKMVSRVMERGRNEMVALELRFEDLQKAGLSLNPRALAPGALADGFLHVLKELKVPPEVQTLLLEVYGEQGVQMMVEFYEGINRVLIERGISPELRIANRRTFRHEHERKPGEDPDAHPRMRAVQTMMEQIARGDWGPGLFRQVLDWQFGAAQPPAADPAGDPPGPYRGLEGAMRSALAAAAQGMPASGVQPGASLTPAQVRAIDHLESVSFAHLSDQRISDRVRTEIARLILPLLESELSRPGEFAVDDNPVRTFIRELATLGYRDQEAPLPDFEAVKTTVDRIIAERGAELNSFQIGTDVLHTLVQRDVDRKLAAEQESAQRRAQARAEASRQRVALELNDRTAGMELDPAVAAFALEMLGPWMMDRYHRHGAQSKQWTEARAFASEFFEAARPAVSEADQARRQMRRTRVMREARLRTQHAGISVGKAGKLLGDLERYFQNLIVVQDAGAAPHRPARTVDFVRTLSTPAG